MGALITQGVLQNKLRGNLILHGFALASPLSGSNKQAFGLSGGQTLPPADAGHLAHLLNHLHTALRFLRLEAVQAVRIA